MNTLTGIEAERVNQIMKHVIDRIQVTSYVPLEWNDDILAKLPTAVASPLEKLWESEVQLRAIGEANGADTGGKDISIVKSCHRSTRIVCKSLQTHRANLQELMQMPEVRSDNIVKFIKYLNELRVQALTRMTTTVEDEAAHRTLLHDLTEKERHLQDHRDALQKKLNEVCDEKEKVTFSLDAMLRKLQLEIQEITQHNTNDMDSVQKEMNDAISKATADHELRMRQLQDQVDGMERQIAEVVERNKDEEVRLRKEKSRAEATLAQKIASYDDDMASKKVTLDQLLADFEVESKEYAVLKEHFDQVDEDLRRQDEEEQILAAVKRREDFGYFYLHTAVAVIQKYVRGRQARQAVAKMAAKNKKGKGKKK